MARLGVLQGEVEVALGRAAQVRKPRRARAAGNRPSGRPSPPASAADGVDARLRQRDRRAGAGREEVELPGRARACGRARRLLRRLRSLGGRRSVHETAIHTIGADKQLRSPRGKVTATALGTCLAVEPIRQRRALIASRRPGEARAPPGGTRAWPRPDRSPSPRSRSGRPRWPEGEPAKLVAGLLVAGDPAKRGAQVRGGGVDLLVGSVAPAPRRVCRPESACAPPAERAVTAGGQRAVSWSACSSAAIASVERPPACAPSSARRRDRSRRSSRRPRQAPRALPLPRSSAASTSPQNAAAILLRRRHRPLLRVGRQRRRRCAESAAFGCAPRARGVGRGWVSAWRGTSPALDHFVTGRSSDRLRRRPAACRRVVRRGDSSSAAPWSIAGAQGA